MISKIIPDDFFKMTINSISNINVHSIYNSIKL